MRDVGWLLRLVLRGTPLLIVLWGLSSLAGGVGEAAGLIALRGAVDALFGSTGRQGHTEMLWVGVLVMAFTVDQVSRLAESYLRERVRISAGFLLQSTALDRIGHLPVDAFDDEGHHNLVSRVAEGTDTKGIDLVADILAILQLIPSIAVSMVALAMAASWLPLIVVAGQAFLVWYGSRTASETRRFDINQTRQRRLADYYAEVLTVRGHAAELRLWALRKEILRRWQETLGTYLRSRLGLAVRNAYAAASGSIGFAMLIPGSLVVLAFAGGTVTPGVAALVLTALRNVAAGIYMMVRSIQSFSRNAGYATDLKSVVDDLVTEESLIKAYAGTIVKQEWPCGAFDAAPKGAEISLRGVSYRYPGSDKEAISDITVTIPAGETVALVGANGAGKTTLTNLITGLRTPTAGTIAIDGVDLSRMPLPEMRSRCTAVFQQPLRYPTSLLNNVTLQETTAVTETVREAITLAGLSGLAIEPETIIGPEFGGNDLSGGQWQKVAIARALARSTAGLVVFDEPTSALDPIAELALFEKFSVLAKRRTTILVSHRLGPTRLADRVIVLDAGRIVEQGSPTELLARGGAFARMYEAQAGWYK